MNSENFIGAIIILCVITIGLLLGFAVQSGKEWNRHIEEYNCVKTGNSKSGTTMIVQKIGGVMIQQHYPYTNYEWKCDDGIYWR